MCSKCSQYWTFSVNSLYINNIRYALMHKFENNTLLAWAEKEDGMFYVIFKAPCGYVKKTIFKKLTCRIDMQKISICTIDEINKAIDSSDAIYKQDNRKHKRNKKLSVSAPALTPPPTPTLTPPTPTPTPTPPTPPTPRLISTTIYNNPIFFELDNMSEDE
jgi:hypothetical protein